MAPMCLIGEGDPFVAQLLQRFAEQSGLAAVRTPVAQGLVELARQLKPAVIFLDPELPGKVRGWEAALALRADPATRAIPLVGCSWLKEADARSLVDQFSGYLHKPDLRYEDFVAALQTAGVIAEADRGR
jgi:CheY-like chemotaxis protein